MSKIFIKNEYPPNYEKIREHFDFTGKNPVFTYGNTIYNPADLEVQPHLMVHEEVHSKQQAKIGVDEWWKQYLEDVNFRLAQELIAYAVQYHYVTKNYKAKAHKFFLDAMANDLSSPMYGNIITKPQAETKIRLMAKSFK